MSTLPMTLHNRNHAVFGLRNVDASRATCDISFNISTSISGSDDINLDAALTISNDAAVGGNTGMSTDVSGIISLIYIFIDDDDDCVLLLECPCMKCCLLLPTIRPWPQSIVDVTSSIMAADVV